MLARPAAWARISPCRPSSSTRAGWSSARPGSRRPEPFFSSSSRISRTAPASCIPCDPYRDGLLLGLGFTTALCWWNLGDFRAGGDVHVWDTYHYYMGTKYFREVAYDRLYACVALAEPAPLLA
jgi:hypothetical protein